MDKKKIIAIIVFIFFGFFVFSFADPVELETVATNQVETKELSINIDDNTFKIEVGSKIPKFVGKVDEGVTLEITNNINNKKTGTYKVIFKATDSKGTTKTIEHDFYVVDTTKPVITLNGGDEIVRINKNYKDKSAKATDNYDGDITNKIVTVNRVNTGKKGTYDVTYNVKDKSGNQALEKVRKVIVVDDTSLINSVKKAKDYLDKTDDKNLKKALDELEKEIKKAENIIDDEKSDQDTIDKEEEKINEIIDKIKNLTFKVKYVDYDNSLISEQTVKYGENSVAPKINGRKGYTFKSWSNDGLNVKSDLVIKAEYSVITYKIEYDLNGGSKTDNKTSYTIETATFKLNKIEKQGYDFDSWIDESGNKITEIKKGTTGDLKLTASFKESENTSYKIVYKYEQLDGTYKEEEKVKTGKTNKEITLKESKAGYKVNEEKSTLTGRIKADGSLVLTVTFDLETYKVKFYVDNKLYKEDNFKFGEKIKVPEYQAKEGYIFETWKIDETMPAKDMSYYASTKKKEFTVTFVYYQNATLVESQKKVKYDETVEAPKYDELVFMNGANPYYLEFQNWDKPLKNIKENTLIKAVYKRLGIATTRLYRLKILNRPSAGAGRNPIWYEELGKNTKIKFVLSSNKISDIITQAKKNKKHEAVLSLNQNEIYSYMTNESKLELKKIEADAIRKYERKNLFVKDCEYEWYVLKYNTNDGWHLDGEVTNCKSIFD